MTNYITASTEYGKQSITNQTKSNFKFLRLGYLRLLRLRKKLWKDTRYDSPFGDDNIAEESLQSKIDGKVNKPRI